MKEFVSELENIMPAEELNFDPTPAFGKYKAIMPEESITHPAKFNTNLVEFLIRNYTKPGDIVLDPMAGTGILGVIAALYGRNAIQVELEEKFYRWMEKARENVEKLVVVGIHKGWIKNICGDARHLSELLSQIDVVVTSPPYSNTNLSGGDQEKRRQRLIKAGYDPKDFLGGKARNAMLKHYSESNTDIGNVDCCITSPPYSDCKKGGEASPEKIEKYARRWEENYEKHGWNSWGKNSHTPGRLRGIMTLMNGYSENKENIGNLPLGNIDCCIMSPPYSNVISKQGGPVYIENVGISTKTAREYSSDPKNIGNLQLGEIDTVITSPPYSETLTKKRKGYTIIPGLERTREMPRDTRDDNIANLPHGNIDCCITSPPYESSLEGSSRHTHGGIASRDPALAQTGTYATVTSSGIPICYSPNPENIGNLKSSDEEYEALVKGLMTKDGKPTYLSEMLKVYREIWKVLKPGGLAIIVVKPFQRQHKIIDLPYHTFLLMRRCGFVLERLYKLRLKNLSFWRILLYKKNPNIPQIRHEYVLVCRKAPFEVG